MSRMDKMAAATDKMGVFDDDTNDLTAMLFADARPLVFDSTGRVMVPDELLKHAGITDTALFVGRGNGFQIWNPAEFEKMQNAALSRLRTLRPDLKING